MRHIFFVVLFLIFDNCLGQNGNLIPLDSLNFVRINNQLVDYYAEFKDSRIEYKFDPEKMKSCSCDIKTGNGLISFRESSIMGKNRCFYIYIENDKYYVRTGEMIRHKNRSPFWRYKLNELGKVTAEKLIHEIQLAILNAEIPKYKYEQQMPLKGEVTMIVFGDIVRDQFAVAELDHEFEADTYKLINDCRNLINKAHKKYFLF